MASKGLMSIIVAACAGPTASPPRSTPPPPQAVSPQAVSTSSAPVSAPAPPPAVVPTAAEIVANMEQAYRSATSYVDQATVEVVVHRTGADRHSEHHYDIAFVRGGALRVESRSNGRWYVVWWDGTQARIQRDDHPKLVVTTTLEVAINQPTGVLDPSVGSVISLLLPDVVTRWPSSLTDLRVVGTERIRNRPCWKLEGRYSDSSAITYWIDRETFLLRRTDTKHRSELSRFAMIAHDSTTTHDPVIDGSVDPALLKPPVARKP